MFDLIGKRRWYFLFSAIAGQIAEKLGHLARGFEVALRVDRELPTRGVERGVQPQAGENVGRETMRRHGVVHAAGGQQRQFVRGGEVAEESDLALLAALTMTLELNVEVVAAEEVLELPQRFAGGLGS